MIANLRLSLANSGSGLIVIAVLTGLFATSHSASATPIKYVFSTGPGTSTGVPVPLSFWAGGVSGSFTYPWPPSATALSPDGVHEYRQVWKSISGSVAGLHFVDPSGRSQVGNDTGPIGPVDFFQLLAEPAPGRLLMGGHNLIGFDTGGYTLTNVRLFWWEGLFGGPDFLTSNNLPDAPPAFEGRLALDFLPIGTSCVAGSDGFCPSSRFVFFDHLSVHPVPEPNSFAIFALGLIAAGASFRTRRRSFFHS